MPSYVPYRTSPIALATHTPSALETNPHCGFTIADRSEAVARWGCKGAGSAAWLAAQGQLVPEKPNSYTYTPKENKHGILVARLGLTEFLLEGPSTPIHALAQASGVAGSIAKLYPVQHQDAALRLCGPHVHDVLRQVCAVDFQSLDYAAQPVVLTNMVGVGVTTLWRGEDFYIWCDGTYGAYLWDTLVDVARGGTSVACITDTA